MFARDKRLHFCAGVLLCLFVGVATNPVRGFWIAAIVGTMKEVIWDKHWRRGTPELLDAVATVVGGFAGVLWLVLFW